MAGTTAPELPTIEQIITETIGWGWTDEAVVLLNLLLISAFTVPILIWRGKTIGRSSRWVLKTVAGQIVGIVYYLFGLLVPNLPPTVGGATEDWVLIDPVGDSLSSKEVATELAQLSKKLGGINYLTVNRENDLIPEENKPDSELAYLISAETSPQNILREIELFNRHHVKPITIQWPVIYRSDKGQQALNTLTVEAQNCHRDMETHDSYIKKFGTLITYVRRWVGQLWERLRSPPDFILVDYYVNPKSREKYGKRLRPECNDTSRTDNISSSAGPVPTEITVTLPATSLLSTAAQYGDVIFHNRIRPPKESDQQSEELIDKIMRRIRGKDPRPDHEKPASQFSVDPVVIIDLDSSCTKSDISELEEIVPNAFAPLDSTHLKIRGELVSGWRKRRLCAVTIDGKGRPRPSSGFSIISIVTGYKSSVIIVHGEHLSHVCAINSDDHNNGLPETGPRDDED